MPQEVKEDFDKSILEKFNVRYSLEQHKRDLLKPFCEDNLFIQNLRSQLVPLKLNSVQSLLDQILLDIQTEGRPMRVVVLKARRFGISSYLLARFYWRCSSRPNESAIVLAHEPDSTAYLFSILRRFHESRKPPIPETRYASQRAIEFNDKEGRGLNSVVSIGSAEKKDFGRSQRISMLLLSEVASYPSYAESDLLAGLLQTVPDEPSTEIFWESTGKGSAGSGMAFYNQFISARYHAEIVLDKEGKPKIITTVNKDASAFNNYTAVFLPWFVHDEYQVSEHGLRDQDLQDDEVLLKKKYHVSLSQLAWRRYAIENRCRGSLFVFRREYPSCSADAWINSDSSVFDQERLSQIVEECVAPKAVLFWDRTLNRFAANAHGDLQMWEEPNTDSFYVIGADASSGESADWCCASVVNHATGDQVAEYRAKLSPDQFGVMLYYLGLLYGWALVCPERTGLGVTTVQKLQVLEYPNIYNEEGVLPSDVSQVRHAYGFNMTSVSKVSIVGWAAELFFSMQHGVKSLDLVREAMSYARDERGRMGASRGLHDDRLVAWMIAQWCRRRAPDKRPFASLFTRAK